MRKKSFFWYALSWEQVQSVNPISSLSQKETAAPEGAAVSLS
jgi:hypothetical protein